ncbi:tyrosine-type recombinase/integrase [Clostridium estertheticum]|uniref:tyrosine-type recombinase/integrase n=1 Tax=Clostridium estertheticum TaxID=238834 RepID=UPI00124E894E|nr:tyrosine-type recombinase/integrase [Clostridium estertheticum]MBZ9616797.1 tyrosine-type recombinase/integrase [Clostridium estertheticum subsp. laramiense]WAG72504.1 tyrosine-type recombinase/integrase [Clostridium estertheticum]
MLEREKTSRGINKAQEVEPIKNPKDIKKLMQYLDGKKNKRDLMLFAVGISVGLRAGDLLKLKWNDILDNKGNMVDSVAIIEEKTDKKREFELNTTAKKGMKVYLDSINDDINMDAYVFRSQKGGALTVESAHKIVKTTLKELNIKGNYGTHTLRKTWAYHMYINNSSNPMMLPYLQQMLNHSSQSVTLKYIGITKEVIKDFYNSVNLW